MEIVSTPTCASILPMKMPIPNITHIYKGNLWTYNWEREWDFDVMDIIQTEEEKQRKIIEQFAIKVLKNTTELDPEIAKIVHETLWDLL